MVKYLWLIATDAITVLVVFAMFGRAETPFQTITISALAIIYMAVLNVGAGFAHTSLHTARAHMAEFARIKKILNDPESLEYEENFLEVDNKLRAADTQFYIHVVFSCLIWVIAVWKILEVVFLRIKI